MSGKYPWLPSEGASELLYTDNNRWRNPVFTQWERTHRRVRRVCPEKSLSLCRVTLKHVYVSRNNRPFKTFFIASSMPNVYFCASEMSLHSCKNSWINSMATSHRSTVFRPAGAQPPPPAVKKCAMCVVEKKHLSSWTCTSQASEACCAAFETNIEHVYRVFFFFHQRWICEA